MTYVTNEGEETTANHFVDSVFILESQEHVNSHSAPALRVSVVLEDGELEMEVDIGATVSVMNITVYNKHFKHIKLTLVERRTT